METALGAANWVLDKVLSKLSDDLVAGYVASSELGLNFDKIKTELNFTLGLLHAAQGRDVPNNPGLHRLLEDLRKRADEAENALDELHYFRIRDKLDGTNIAEPWVPDDLHGQVVHGRSALRHAVGNCLACFSCSRTQDDVGDLGVNPQTSLDIDHFDRVTMSNTIKSVIEGMHSLCDPISRLLNIPNSNNPVGGMTTTRVTTPLIQQDKLYGRDAIFKQTLSDMTSGAVCHETLSVLPIFGTGGIGKTTFAQYLYKETKEHFTARAWVCVSTNFDVCKLTKGILASLHANKSDDSSREIESDHLESLQQSIMKKLKSQRFLIVLDDIWEYNQEKWESLLAPLKNSDPEKGSIVLITTRSYGIARDVKTTNPIHLKGLEATEFREFFLEDVLGQVTDEYGKKFLIDVARQIADKLKGSPLAAKTVGRLMKNRPTLEHWKGILEREEWRNETNNDDIMPALKISYDYLPLHLKKCFPFLALFPEDHRFRKLEITCFWSAIGIIQTRNDKIEDIGSVYLDELVDHGFLLNEDDINKYVLHDLLHELARTISSQECINICSSSLKADCIPPTIRHLSLTMTDKFSVDFEQEMTKLKNTIDIANLRTLMIFGSYDTSVDCVLKNAFEKVKRLRVLFIRMDTEESLPNNFPKLLHLRFLKIHSPRLEEISLPGTLSQFLASTVSQFYLLEFLDLKDFDPFTKLPENISRLCNIRHFFATEEFHSSVPGVGKWKNLQELKKFHVNKEGSVGFEIEQLGDLIELGGELKICNLEQVNTKEEAMTARLVGKKNLKGLMLVWGEQQLAVGADVLDSLQPHSNLRKLSVINPPGSIGPSWLCSDLTLQNLEFLCLKGISWVTLPPFGQMPHLRELTLEKITELRQFNLAFGGFAPLQSITFDSIPELLEWVRDETCELFPLLKKVRCSRCPMLTKLPILGFPNLEELRISECPKLSLPPMPHTSTLEYFDVDGRLKYKNMRCYINSYKGDLAFHHLGEAESIYITYWPVGPSNEDKEVELELSSCKSLQTLVVQACSNLIISVKDGGPLRNLTSLRKFHIENCERMFSMWSTDEAPQIMNPFPASLKELSIQTELSIQSMGLFSNLTSLTELELAYCKKLTIDGFNPLMTMNLTSLKIYWCGSLAADLLSEVARMTEKLPQGAFRLTKLVVDSISAVLVAPICSRLTATLKSLQFFLDMEAEGFTEEQEQALQLLTSLETVTFFGCHALQSLPEALHCLPSLRELEILYSSKLRSLPKKDLPASLEKLCIRGCSREIEEECKILKETRPNLELTDW